MRKFSLVAAGLALAALSGTAQSQLTLTSPAGGALPSGVTRVGGIVTDLLGLNGSHVISQIPASSLYEGFACSSASGQAGGCSSWWDVADQVNPLLIGLLNGFSPSVMSSLGGGLTAAAFRFSLYDGDTGPGDFDSGQNTLLVNGFGFPGANWSSVTTVRTDELGNQIGGTYAGFLDDQLMTGWFASSDATFLGMLYANLLATETLRFQLVDTDPGDNYYDFTRGIDGTLIDVGTGPVVTPPTSVPEPATILLMATGLAGLAAASRRRARNR